MLVLLRSLHGHSTILATAPSELHGQMINCKKGDHSTCSWRIDWELRFSTSAWQHLDRERLTVKSPRPLVCNGALMRVEDLCKIAASN
ncbi:hypothetical protein Haur_4291 [Herpetosiphon aurantiacus DSM 785]|uniref:Uncharacterized protein n=1 Tax=Herpetosiphon aurantiacus (strain ATCC 23779 / DSM 785 / 114-95) TaxID=316274 RepID=A9AY41_HERA2|nr:hypothetical protein Haur_4291 [Herpetosiphon aurantiacus DSM 785]